MVWTCCQTNCRRMRNFFFIEQCANTSCGHERCARCDWDFLTDGPPDYEHVFMLSLMRELNNWALPTDSALMCTMVEKALVYQFESRLELSLENGAADRYEADMQTDLTTLMGRAATEARRTIAERDEAGTDETTVVRPDAQPPRPLTNGHHSGPLTNGNHARTAGQAWSLPDTSREEESEVQDENQPPVTARQLRRMRPEWARARRNNR